MADTKEKYERIISTLESMECRANVEGMARYGITSKKVYGVKMPVLRQLAKEARRDARLADMLWKQGSLEARMIAGMTADPADFGERKIASWVREFDNWAICDGSCMNLFEKTAAARELCFKWSDRPEEFFKRTAFVLMARLAVSDKAAPDSLFLDMLPVIEREAGDSRNLVKKAVNWALRQIGKRNRALNAAAIASARRLKGSESSAARWVAADALRELEGDAVQKRLAAKKTPR